MRYDMYYKVENKLRIKDLPVPLEQWYETNTNNGLITVVQPDGVVYAEPCCVVYTLSPLFHEQDINRLRLIGGEVKWGESFLI